MKNTGGSMHKRVTLLINRINSAYHVYKFTRSRVADSLSAQDNWRIGNSEQQHSEIADSTSSNLKYRRVVR